jgi:hypothetical protein
MNLGLCLACIETEQIKALCVYLPIGAFMVVGFIWASCRCHSVGFIIEEVHGFVNAIVGVSEDSIVGLVVGSVISSVESDLSLFLFLPCSVVDESCAVAGLMINMRLIIVPAGVQEDGEVMEHFPSGNMVLCPPISN